MTRVDATLDAARLGRETLAVASLALQTARIDAAYVARAIELTAGAADALYQAESQAKTEEAVVSYIHTATERLSKALSDVEKLRRTYPDCEIAAASIARTLALLYPVLQLSLRKRRNRIQVGALTDSDVSELKHQHGAAEASTGRAPRERSFEGAERRHPAGKRFVIEVDIGLYSDSHFYTGLSLDVSTGGVFVATYQPLAEGTKVLLHFVLPDGHAVSAEGVVRWTRRGNEEAPPGMGVAFTNLAPISVQHIASFCEDRPPLFFE